MNQLWAPWRMEYILSGNDRAAGCIFCDLPAAGPACYRQHLILCASDHAFAIMNKFPYNNGHVLVVPRRHAADPADLQTDEHRSLSDLLRGATMALRAALAVDGLNVGMNLGRSAGAGIADHCHWHLVPRWSGDTNFMAAVAETRVISDHLRTTYDRLLAHFAHLGQGPA
mgnify:CR=1 FL=1